MKKNITILSKRLVLLILIISLNVLAKSQTVTYNVSFTSAPEFLNSNTVADLAVGAKYKFTNVASNTDAVVTIVSATGGATLDALDDNNLTKPEAFSPRVKLVNGTTGMIEFQIDLFVTGTNTAKSMGSLAVTAIDIDGSKDANGNYLMQEMDALNLGGGTISYQSSNLEINVVQNGNEYMATNMAGIEYVGVDTAAKAVMYTITNSNVSSFTYKAGGYNNFGVDAVRQKAIYFKGFTYPTLNPLSVKYQTWAANAVNDAVKLNWTTIDVVNHDYFDVQRSFDGINFTTIAKVKSGVANGLSTAYALLDDAKELQSNTAAYYRLKQIDVDGIFAYSNILMVRLTPRVITSMEVLPNPFVEKLSVKFSSQETAKAELRITNMSGKTVMVKQYNASKGNNTLQLEGLSSLPNGVFIATIIVNGKIIDSKKIIK